MPCPNGHPTPPAAAFCPTCGLAVPGQTLQPYAPPQNVPAPTIPPPGLQYGTPPSLYRPAGPVAVLTQPRGMYTAAAVVNWVVLGLIILGSAGVGIICAAWFVPMTIQMHKGAKSPYKHTALGVCSLLFCNLVSGILLLADDGGKPARPLPR